MEQITLRPSCKRILPPSAHFKSSVFHFEGKFKRRNTALGALPPLEHLDSIVSHLVLLYEPIVLPCSSMNCGDILHRSTLDPVLRMEQRAITPQGIALIAAITSYMFARPGILAGAIDTYIKAPLQQARAQAFCKEDFDIGKKLASGGFGTVYRADLIAADGSRSPVVVKKATEFGEAEVWMNERLTRAAPRHIAQYIGAFNDDNPAPGSPLWLVWKYEGDYTLSELMIKKDFPDNVEKLVFERNLAIPQGPERKAIVLKTLMKQLLSALEACHTNGIVHRDVKPQNLIFSTTDKKLKFIDLGAAADLRVGINYVPNQFLLDPRYAPPQQYIMSSQTPRAPPAPFAALLSPILWQLECPDRFDMWSAGVTMLQLAFPNLRTDNALIAFNKQFSEQYNWDLKRWRRAQELKKGGKEYAEGFATLDADDGAAWELLCKLMTYEPKERLSASAALAHRWFGSSPLPRAVTSSVESFGKAVPLIPLDGSWFGDAISSTGTRKVGGLTEAVINDELQDVTVPGNNSGGWFRRPPSATVVWWKQRQSDIEKRLSKRKISAKLKKAAKTVKDGGGGLLASVLMGLNNKKRVFSSMDD